MKCVSLALLLMSVGLECIAQNPATGNSGLLPNVVSASPEAASLGKFGEWPVSQYTGVPDISIPLYTIKIKNVEVPIQLSYHASGIRVDEMASCVGTGWALNAGGALTRTIVGVADDDPSYGLITGYQSGQYLKGVYNLMSLDDYTFFRRVADRLADTDPDIYYYNFAGTSGKFCFDSTGTFHAIPANNLQIVQSAFSAQQGVPATNTEWVVTDDKGNSYVFGSTDSVSGGTNGVERTNSGTAPLKIENRVITAWYLTKIITADRADTIYFDYGPKNEYYLLAQTLSFNAWAPSSGALPAISTGTWQTILSANTTLFNGSPTSGAPVNASETVGASFLQRIRWRGGEVDFIAHTQRQDMVTSASNMLDSVYVYNSDKTMTDAFVLSYTYVQNRYFLDSIANVSPDKNIVLKTKLSYISRSSLPASASPTGVGSYDQDHWGYYNGAGNTTLLPMDPDVLAVQGAGAGSSTTANREPDTVKMQYGTLNKIVYPTGGSTVFTYESNRYDPSTTTVIVPPQTIITTTTTVDVGNTASPYAQIASFAPGITQTANLIINVFNYGHPPSKNMSWLPYIILYSKNTSGVLTQMYYEDAFDNFPSSGVTANPNGFYNYSFTIPNVSLQAGTSYVLVASDTCLKLINCVDQQNPMPNMSALIQYSTYTQVSPGGGSLPLPIAGGLRIKQIANYDQAGNFVLAKNYTYAPGHLLEYPSYSRHFQEDVSQAATSNQSGVDPPIFCQVEADMWQEFSTSQVLLGVTQGSPVGYTQVTETSIDGSGVDNGYVNYFFSFSADSANLLNIDGTYSPWNGMQVVNPTVPFNDFDYKRGLLLEKDIYSKQQSGSYAKIQSTVNNYNFNDFNAVNRYARIRGMRVQRLRSILGTSGQYNCGTSYNGYVIPNDAPSAVSPDFGYAFYDIISAWVQKTSTITTTYDQNGLNPLVSETNFYYDNPSHMNVTRSTTNRSKGDSVTDLVSYPQDYAPGTPFIDSLVSHHTISLPIEEVRYQRAGSSTVTILSGRVNSYVSDGKGVLSNIALVESASPVALDSFKFSNVGSAGTLPYNAGTRTSLSMDSRYVARANFLSYDRFENIAQDAKSSDMNQSYVWDYNGVYPIAIIKNAGLTDIAYTSFEADGTGNWTIPDTTRKRSSGITGSLSYTLTGSNAITKASLNSSSTYIVSYWDSSGSAVTINGAAGAVKATFGNWTCYEAQIKGATTITVGGTGVIDELRLYPKGALMTTYTYAPLIGITSQCDASGKIIYYTYDGLGRLKLVKDQYGNILKRYDYQYQTNNQ